MTRLPVAIVASLLLLGAGAGAQERTEPAAKRLRGVIARKRTRHHALDLVELANQSGDLATGDGPLLAMSPKCRNVCAQLWASVNAGLSRTSTS